MRHSKLEQAVLALLAHWDTPAWKYLKPTGDLMADLREALAEQAEQEPVAWIEIERGIPMFVRFADKYKPNCDGFIPLYDAAIRAREKNDN